MNFGKFHSARLIFRRSEYNPLVSANGLDFCQERLNVCSLYRVLPVLALYQSNIASAAESRKPDYYINFIFTVFCHDRFQMFRLVVRQLTRGVEPAFNIQLKSFRGQIWRWIITTGVPHVDVRYEAPSHALKLFL